VTDLTLAGWLIVKGSCLRAVMWVMRTFGFVHTPDWLELAILNYERDVDRVTARLHAEK
jgi:hypothetical protein